MSQFNASLNGVQPSQIELIQFADQPQAGRTGQPTLARAPEGMRINDVVDRTEPLPYQQRRAARSSLAQAGYVLARVMGAVATVGVSEGIIAAVHRSEKVSAQEQRQLALERRQAAVQSNRRIGDALLRGAPLDSPALSSAVSEAVAELRTACPGMVPGNAATLDDLPASIGIRQAVKAGLASLTEDATPAQLKELILDKALPFLRGTAVSAALARALEGMGHAADKLDLRAAAMLKRFPDLADAVGRAGDGSAISRVLEAHRSSIEACAAFIKGSEQAMEEAVQTLADIAGLSPGIVRERADLSPLKEASDTFGAGFDPKLSAEETASVCRDRAAAFVKDRLELMLSADELPLSDALKAMWKSDALTQSSLDAPATFRNAAGAAGRVGADIRSALAGHLRLAAPDREHLAFLAHGLANELGQELAKTPDWDAMSVSQRQQLRQLAAQALIDMDPELRTAFESHADLLTAVREAAEQGSSDIELQTVCFFEALEARTAHNGRLAAALSGSQGAPELPLGYLQALREAEADVRASFPGVELPEDFMASYPSSGARLDKQLSEALKNAGGTVAPADLRAMAEALMRQSAADALLKAWVLESVEASGDRLAPREESVIMTLLHRRHPELAEISSSAGAVEVKEALGNMGVELNAMIRVRLDQAKSIDVGRDYAVSRMSVETGIPMEQLQRELNAAKLESAFSRMTESIREQLLDPALPPESFPSSEKIFGDVEKLVESFVERKSALFHSVDSFPIPDTLKASLKNDVIRESVLNTPDFLVKCSNAARAMAPQELLDTMRREGVTGQELYESLRHLIAQYDEVIHVAFTQEELNRMGPEERSGILHNAFQLFFGMNPELQGLLTHERFQEMKAICERELDSMNEKLSQRHSTEEFEVLRRENAQLNLAGSFLILLGRFYANTGAESR